MGESMRARIETINTCINRQSEFFGSWARRNGMSRSAMMVLYALDRDHARTQQEIAGWWLLPKQTVHTVVKDLEARGLVTLEAGRDQKEKRIRFTPEGALRVREQMQSLYAAEERALAALEPDLREGLVRGLLAFTDAMEREAGHGA